MKLTKETVQVWAELLEDLDPIDIIEAFREALLESEFQTVPTVGVIRGKAKASMRARLGIRESGILKQIASLSEARTARVKELARLESLGIKMPRLADYGPGRLSEYIADYERFLRESALATGDSVDKSGN